MGKERTDVGRVRAQGCGCVFSLFLFTKCAFAHTWTATLHTVALASAHQQSRCGLDRTLCRTPQHSA
eukprot:1195077-Rhodomonas_salina.1